MINKPTKLLLGLSAIGVVAVALLPTLKEDVGSFFADTSTSVRCASISFGNVTSGDATVLSDVSRLTAINIGVSSVSATKVYAPENAAARFSTSSADGSLTITFNKSYPIKDIKALAYGWGSDSGVALSIADGTGTPKSKTISQNLSSSSASIPNVDDCTKSNWYTYSGFDEDVSSIVLQATKRVFLAKLVFVYGENEEESTPSSEPSSSTPSSSSSSSSSSSYSESAEVTAYYKGIDFTQTKATLKTALSERISANYVSKSYDYCYTAYKTTDVDSDGKIIDIYSACRFDPETDHQGAANKSNYSKEGDLYNREHTIPQSIFSEASPMKSDLHHVYPTDGYVNNRRSNHPHAYVGTTVSYTSTNGTKVGKGGTKNGGYTSDACEVPDEYKGDVARAYFYMVTRYESLLSGWKTYAAFSQNTYPSLTSWAVKVYLEWNDLDPVSEKEIKRNNAVYAIQKNRNPFVDHPEAVHKIWDNAY